MPHFFLKLIAPRPTFAMDMSEQEKALMQEHLIYWQGLQSQGRVLVFGPVLDPKGPFGMAIVEAAEQAAAQNMVDADPCLSANCGFAAEIHPMRAVTREAAN